jgi:hypothetical protein
MREEALIDSVKATSAMSKHEPLNQQSKQASPHTQSVTKSKNLSESTKATKATKNPSDNIY